LHYRQSITNKTFYYFLLHLIILWNSIEEENLLIQYRQKKQRVS
jgi:hypothetical protein